MYTFTQENKRVEFFFQRKYVANDIYTVDLKALLEVVESYSGGYGKDQGLVK